MAKKLDRRPAFVGEIFFVANPTLARALVEGGEPGCCEVHEKTEGNEGQWICISCCVPLQNNWEKDSHCETTRKGKSCLTGELADGVPDAKHVLAWRSFVSGKVEAP